MIVSPPFLHTVREVIEIISAFRFDRAEDELALFVVDLYPPDVGDGVAGFRLYDQETMVFNVFVRPPPVERELHGFGGVIDSQYGTVVSQGFFPLGSGYGIGVWCLWRIMYAGHSQAGE